MRVSDLGKRSGLIVSFCCLALCAAVSCSSDSTKKAVQTPGAAGAADAGGAGAPTGPGDAGDAGKGSTPAGGDTSEGGAAGEPGAAGQPSTAGTGGTSGTAGTAGTAGSAGASTAFTSIAEADFEATFAKVFCDSLAHCCSAGVATCLDTEAKDFASIHTMAKGNNNVYDAKHAAQCANAIVALGDHAICNTSFMSREDTLVPCRGIFDGTVAPGDQCSSVVTCQQGIADQPAVGGFAGCLPLNGGGVTRCRQFVIATTPGATCQAVPTAGTDGVVHICSHDMTCKSGQCVPQPKVGEACPDAVCFNSLCSNGTCVAYTKEGQACTASTCEFAHDCIGDKCTSVSNGTWILDAGFFDTTYACPS